jgi:hypothetical protein
MYTSLVDPMKRAGFLALVSAVAMIATILLWLKFPSFIPIAVLIPVGIVAGGVFIISEIWFLLRIVRRLRTSTGPSLGTGRLRPRAFLSLVIVLLLGNGALFFWQSAGTNFAILAMTNLAIIVSWWVLQWRFRPTKEP